MTRGYLGIGRRCAVGGMLRTSMVAFACLFGSPALTHSQIKPNSPGKPAAAGPSQFSTPQNSPMSREKGIAPEAVWRELPMRFRGSIPAGELLFDNGEPIDDFGNPASQLSEALAPWNFIAAAADDFSITDSVSPDTVARISTVRVAFHFFQSGAPSATPTTTWTGGVYVTIYENAVGNIPSGQPNNMGGHTGTVVASQLVPMAELENQTLVNACRPAYVVDIPVDLLVEKNHTYWISVVPRHFAPPQSAWMLSTDLPVDVSMSKVFFPLVGINSWSNNPGNLGFCVDPGTPSAGEARELSFQLYGQKIVTDIGACCNAETGMCTTVSDASECMAPFDVFHIGTICSLLDPPCAPVVGACCNDTTALCTDNVGIADCQDMDERFEPDTLCANLVPPCGDTTPGACCKPDGTCEDLSILDCENMNGVWTAGTCATVQCPPINDSCQFKLTITGGFSPFSTLGATTDGPPDAGPGCPIITNDIWYSYTAECTGTLHVSLCDGTDFDSALAVYDSCFCPPVLGPRLACNDDGCMMPGGASRVSLPVTMGNCYLIRIGGVAGAAGSGNLQIDCVPTGQGACCHADHTCEVIPAAACITPDVFTPGEPCNPITCPPPENDPCDGALTLGEGVTPFVTNGASTDGPADTPNPPCTLITNDVWYSYVATCDGNVTIDLCGASFNAAMSVYDGCACPVGAAPITCDDDGCLPGGAPTVTFPVEAGNCYLVRIGGVVGATGTGEITVTCDPYGACCFPDGHCEELVEADCIAALGTFSGPGTNCTPNNCPQPTGSCCQAGGICSVVTELECDGLSGVFTVGATCSPNPCPGPEGNCTPTHVIELAATPPLAGIQMGRATALHGDTLVVGAPEQGPSGAAYVFVRAAGVWTQQAMLTPSDAPSSASFGEYIDIDGDTIIVGADNAESNAGAAYVFVRSAGIWGEQAKLTVMGSTNLAASVAVSGDWAMIGTYTGERIEVFQRTGIAWSHIQTLTHPDALVNADYGYSVAISGDYAVVGARHDNLVGFNYGAAFAYFQNGGGWILQDRLEADDAATGQRFGVAVSIDGDAIAVATALHASGRTFHVFRRNGVTWPHEARMTVSESVGGFSDAPFIALVGNVAVVGTDSDSAGGAAFVFRRLAAGWTELTKLLAPGSAPGDSVGWSVAVDGNTVAIGAPFDDTAASNAGAAHVFDLSCEAACCLITGTCQLITEPACDVTSGTYLGVGTKCGPNPCPQPIGACCLMGGICQEDQTEIECNGNGGTFQGPGSVCDPNPCLQPPGACCLPDGSCQFLDSAACSLANGDFQGTDILCQDVTCPVFCCPGDMQGDGDIDLIDLDPLINAVLNPPLPADPEFCRADVNGDSAVDGLDLGAFTALILPGYATCPPASVICCPGDCNSDGTINGLDINEFIIRLLANPPLGSLELCVADVNEDEVLDLTDADALVSKLLAGDTCP